MKLEEVTVYQKAREEDKRRNKQRTVLEIKPNEPPNNPPNDPWFMSCQTGPRAITDHQVKKMNLPPIQKRYVGGMTKGTFPPCKRNMLNNLSKILFDMVIQEPEIHGFDPKNHRKIQKKGQQQQSLRPPGYRASPNVLPGLKSQSRSRYDFDQLWRDKPIVPNWGDSDLLHRDGFGWDGYLFILFGGFQSGDFREISSMGWPLKYRIPMSLTISP